jgi:hypothetical protein
MIKTVSFSARAEGHPDWKYHWLYIETLGVIFIVIVENIIAISI